MLVRVCLYLHHCKHLSTEPTFNLPGLFPSNYVERLEPETHTGPSATYKTSNFGSYNNSSSSHPTTDSTGLTQPASEEQKKGKFGGLGKTMANGAAGGVGFGAGSSCL